jgi:ankyrin repeat protein
MNGHLKKARLLLDRGADIEHHNSVGETALCLARGKGHFEMAHSLLDRGPTCTREQQWKDSPRLCT